MSSETERRRPQQERARQTVDAIVEAAGRVIADAGLDQATTSRIARVAGVSIGSLYQYFPGKEALLSSLIRRQAELDRARVESAIVTSRGRPLEERILFVVDAGLGPVLARPRLFVFILTYLPELGMLPVARELERDLADAMHRLLGEHRHELRPIDLDLASVAMTGALRGALIALAHHRPEKLERADELREQLVAATRSVLAGIRR